MTVAIGFLNTSYTVNKDDGLVNIQIGITEGTYITDFSGIHILYQPKSITDRWGVSQL